MPLSRTLLAAITAGAAAACVGASVPPPDASLREAPTPPGFGAGFVDLTPGIEAPRPFEIPPPHPQRGLSRTFGTFVDFDGDGRSELQLGVVSAHARRYRYDAIAGRLIAIGGVDAPVESAVLGGADLDGDGAVDLLYDTRPEIAWGPLSARPARVPVDVRSLQPGWTHAAVDDVDSDGWLDVLLGSGDCREDGRALALMLQDAPRHFVDRSDLLPGGGATRPYVVASYEFVPGEKLLAQLGAACDEREGAPAFFRSAAPDALGFPAFEAFDPTPPDAFFRSVGPSPSLASMSPMGATTADFDGNGQLDLAVTLDNFVGVFTGSGSWPFRDRTAATSLVRAKADGGRVMIPWGIAAPDLDRDGRPDLVTVYGDDHAFFDPSHWVGPVQVLARWNAGDLRLVDVTDRVGLGRRGQWMSLALGDLEHDGDADLVVGGQGELPRVYRNDVDAGNEGFSLRLRGTSSNPHGIGARVTVWPADGDGARHFVVAPIASLRVVSEPLVFVGLGAHASAARTRIEWPSGVVQELEGLAAGRLHTIEEPRLFAIEPASRHLAPDATARVRITPRLPDGLADADAQVSVRIAHGIGRVVAVRREDEAWVAELDAGGARGAAVVEIAIDGVPSRVRPRLSWDAR